LANRLFIKHKLWDGPLVEHRINL